MITIFHKILLEKNAHGAITVLHGALWVPEKTLSRTTLLIEESSKSLPATNTPLVQHSGHSLRNLPTFTGGNIILRLHKFGFFPSQKPLGDYRCDGKRREVGWNLKRNRNCSTATYIGQEQNIGKSWRHQHKCHLLLATFSQLIKVPMLFLQESRKILLKN